MDKKEARKLGAWIMLLGGCCFVAGALAALYIAWRVTPQRAGRIVAWLGHFHRS